VSLEDDIKAEASDRELRQALGTALRQLARAKAKTEDLVEAVYRAVGDAMVAKPPKAVTAPRHDRRKGHPEVALWHLTDWQGSKVTTTYNSEVMRTRVHAFVDTATDITAIQRTHHPVPGCVILFGGDMIEGLFNYPTQAFEVDASLFDQWTGVSNLMVEVVRRALATHETVTVIAEWGNHGRIGSKRDVVPRADNFDRMCYAAARMMLGHQPRLTWQDSAEDIQRVEIGNYRALSMHGDETGRNGFTSTGTFLSYLNKLKAGGYGWTFRDVYTGHRHVDGEDTLADGAGTWYRTGSTESDNRYARDGLGSAAVPSQRLHFIEPERGIVTARYKIHLDG
jgi:hypothetical protein